MGKKYWLFVAALLLLGSGCVPQSSARQGRQQTTSQESRHLTVFAAASLTEAFGAIKESYEAGEPGVEVTLNLASSAQLAQQLAQGAPADVFASADIHNMEPVAAAGRLSGDMQQIFARNRLVLVTPKDNPAGIQSLADLAKPGLRLLLASQEVPVGAYSLEFLGKAARDPSFGRTYEENVLKNVASYEENVKAVFSKVAVGEADAGIVYTSDISKGNQVKIHSLEIPEPLNVVAEYAISPLRDSQQKDLAQAFVDFVVSPAGQQILKDYGFIPLNQ